MKEDNINDNINARVESDTLCNHWARCSLICNVADNSTKRRIKLMCTWNISHDTSILTRIDGKSIKSTLISWLFYNMKRNAEIKLCEIYHIMVEYVDWDTEFCLDIVHHEA